MKKTLYKAYAKINLFLKIKGSLENGYHELEMVTVPLELHDSLLIEELKSSLDNYVTMDDFSLVESDKNLAQFALDRFAEEFPHPRKYKILIHKRIPIRAGLGGGSSDAAAALKMCAERSKEKINVDELNNLAKELGADVPFFLQEKPCKCEGIGEILEPVEIKNNYYCLLVSPRTGCSTKEVYQAYERQTNKNDIENVIKALKDGDDDLLADSIGNDLQEPAIKKVPEIAHIIDVLKDKGFKIVMMSGSGSTVFALTTDKSFATKMEKQLYEEKYNVILTKLRK